MDSKKVVSKNDSFSDFWATQMLGTLFCDLLASPEPTYFL
jgi:hypothetical protein